MVWPTELAAFCPYTSYRPLILVMAIILVVAVSAWSIVADKKYPYLSPAGSGMS
jgi:hypothetical protein